MDIRCERFSITICSLFTVCSSIPKVIAEANTRNQVCDLSDTSSILFDII